MKPRFRPRSPLTMVLLTLAAEEPMHPYRMQALIKERGKDQIVNVAQRNSVYQTIDAMVRAGLLAIHATARGAPDLERHVAPPDGGAVRARARVESPCVARSRTAQRPRETRDARGRAVTGTPRTPCRERSEAVMASRCARLLRSSRMPAAP